MHCEQKLAEGLYWIGGDDKRLEASHPVPHGMSYNNYLLLDEKVVLFDTIDRAVEERFFETVDYLLDGRKIDYIIVSHMEPDHSATLGAMAAMHPEAQLVCTKVCKTLIGQFFDPELAARCLVVGDGDSIETGAHTLAFATAPMVHWPEVMVTYDEKDKILFSADAFGTFGALAGNIFNDEITFDTVWMNDARRYYTNIVGKYGVQVQALLKKAASLDIEMICPLHGPIWRKDLGLLLEKYQKWSTYEPEDKTVMIAYATMYGNTENAANVLAGMLADKGVKNIAMYDVSETDVSELVAESFRCSHLVLAAPTYNSGIQPKMEAYLSDIKALNLQNRTVAVIDNGTWAATAGKQMIGMLEGMKNMTILENTISIKSALAENQLGALEALADELAKQVNG